MVRMDDGGPVPMIWAPIAKTAAIVMVLGGRETGRQVGDNMLLCVCRNCPGYCFEGKNGYQVLVQERDCKALESA